MAAEGKPTTDPNAIAGLRLMNPDRAVRLVAAQELQSNAGIELVPVLEKALAKETDSTIKQLLSFALAQANLDGGGNTDENRRAKTPLPSTQHQVVGADIQQSQRRVQELEPIQQKMLPQAKSLRNVAASQTASEQPAPAPSVSGLDLAESARAMARLEGEISKSTDEYSKRPRKKFIGARAEEYRFAQYIEDWRPKIERIGTLNYPAAGGGKLYGPLSLKGSNLRGGTGRPV